MSIEEKKMKNKVGIITIIGNNYGNRLQNWALQEVLKGYFHRVVTIPYYKEPITKQKIKYCLEKIKKYFHLKNNLEDPWYDFYFKICWESDSIHELKPEKYDYFVAGSDQIWNPLFEYNSEREFLTFANNGQKIAYAASIGLSELPVEYFEQYRNFLYDFENISVRETEAANIVFQLTDRKVPVVLDPVFLIDQKEWCELSQKSKTIIQKPYIFKYFLGEINDKIEEYIHNLSIKQNLQIVDIMDMFSINGPIEFISLIQNASLIVTNSFHCTAFSIIFERDFLTFNRQKTKGTGDMSSRITTLLEKFELNSRFVNGNYDKKLNPIKWDRVRAILMRERAISLKYIEESIGGKDEKCKSA